MSSAREVTERSREERKNRTATHVTNLNSEINNPCLKEHNLTNKCLDDNSYNRDACQLYFVNYQNCKDFWFRISVERRRKGLKPYLPEPKEREQIKGDYLKSNPMN